MTATRWVGAHAAKLGAVIALVGVTACGRSDADDRVNRLELRARMRPAVGAEMSWTFTVRQSGPHDLSLEFPSPIEDAAVADAVQRAASSVGSAGQVPAEFDFSWRVVDDGKEVASGSGQEGVRGIIDSSEDDPRGTPVKSRALVFGTFPAETGVKYTLRVVPQSGFVPLFRVNPAFLVERKPAS
jgi:hypothetical protein